MKIVLEDVRSIQKAEFDLPDTGLVQFTGPNSHGKSVLADVLKRINSKKIMDRVERVDNVIRYGCPAAFLSIERTDGYTLVVKVHAERHESKMMLQRPDGTKILRSLREGGWPELLEEFGFMVFDAGALVMQLHETFGLVPFITTERDTNYRMVESISTDNKAKEFVELYKGVTHKSARELIKRIDTNLAAQKDAKASIVTYDYEKFKEVKEKLQVCLDNMKGLSKITLSMIPIPPDVEVIDIKCKELSYIPLVEALPVFEGITDLSKIISDIATLSEGVCPLCEREFY